MEIEKIQDKNNIYLKEKINPVMIKLIKSLMKDKPINYLEYMINWFKDITLGTENINNNQTKKVKIFHNFLNILDKKDKREFELKDDKNKFNLVEIKDYKFHLPKIELINKNMFENINLKSKREEEDLEKINPMSIIEEYEKNLNVSIAGEKTNERIKNEEKFKLEEVSSSIDKKLKKKKSLKVKKRVIKVSSKKIKIENDNIKIDEEPYKIDSNNKNLYDELTENYSNNLISIPKQEKKVKKTVSFENNNENTNSINKITEEEEDIKEENIKNINKKNENSKDFDNDDEVEESLKESIKNTNEENLEVEEIEESIKDNEEIEESIKDNEEIDDSIKDNEEIEESIKDNEEIEESIKDNEEIEESIKDNEEIDDSIKDNEEIDDSIKDNEEIDDSIKDDSVKDNEKIYDSIKDESIKDTPKNKNKSIKFKKNYIKGYLVIKIIHLRQINEINEDWKPYIQIIYPNGDLKNSNIIKDFKNSVLLNQSSNKLLIVNKDKKNKIKVFLKTGIKNDNISSIIINIDNCTNNINSWEINGEYNMYDIENKRLIKNKIYFMVMFCNKPKLSKKLPKISYNLKNDFNNSITNGTLIVNIKKFISWVSIILNNNINKNTEEINNIFNLVQDLKDKPDYKLVYNDINSVFEVTYPNLQMFKSDNFKGPTNNNDFEFSSKINIKPENLPPLIVNNSILTKDFKSKISYTIIDIEKLFKSKIVLNDVYYLNSYFKSIKNNIIENIPKLDLKFFEPVGKIYLEAYFITQQNNAKDFNTKKNKGLELPDLSEFLKNNYILGINIEGIDRLYKNSYLENNTKIIIKWNNLKTLKTNTEKGLCPIFNTISFVEYENHISNILDIQIKNKNFTNLKELKCDLKSIFNNEYLKELENDEEENNQGFNWVNHQIKFNSDNFISINLCLIKMSNFEKIKEFNIEAPIPSLNFKEMIDINRNLVNNIIFGFIKFKFLEIKNLVFYDEKKHETFNIYIKFSLNNFKTEKLDYTKNNSLNQEFILDLNNDQKEILNNFYLDIFRKDEKSDIFMGRIEWDISRIFNNLNEISYNGYYDIYDKKENLDKNEIPLTLGKLGFQLIYSDSKKFFTEEIEFPYK